MALLITRCLSSTYNSKSGSFVTKKVTCLAIETIIPVLFIRIHSFCLVDMNQAFGRMTYTSTIFVQVNGHQFLLVG